MKKDLLYLKEISNSNQIKFTDTRLYRNAFDINVIKELIGSSVVLFLVSLFIENMISMIVYLKPSFYFYFSLYVLISIPTIAYSTICILHFVDIKRKKKARAKINKKNKILNKYFKGLNKDFILIALKELFKELEENNVIEYKNRIYTSSLSKKKLKKMIKNKVKKFEKLKVKEDLIKENYIKNKLIKEKNEFKRIDKEINNMFK